MSIKDSIIVVSGLPRSGTSMMMNMLAAGGLALLTDGLRPADANNPKGYFELDRVKKLPEDNAWVGAAKGCVVKVVSQLLKSLPPEHHYRVVFMLRNLQEVLASQAAMLERLGHEQANGVDTDLQVIFEQHLKATRAWLTARDNFDILYVSYNEIVRHPQASVMEVDRFLGGGLDSARMLDVVDKALYRQQQQEAVG